MAAFVQNAVISLVSRAPGSIVLPNGKSAKSSGVECRGGDQVVTWLCPLTIHISAMLPLLLLSFSVVARRCLSRK